MADMLKKILFVDDDQNFLDSIRRIFAVEKYPWKIITANSAAEALKIDHINKMDVILTDLLMPQQDGFWFITQIQQDPLLRDIPIIVLTGYGEDHLKRKALQMGAADLLSKPVYPDDLFVRISSSLRIKEYQDALKQKNETLEKEVERRTKQLELSRLEIIWKLARAGEFRDEQTGNHVMRVGSFSQILAHGLQLPEEEEYLIFLTSPLHDIGKIGIPDQILNKPSPLSSKEMEEIKNHCIYGNQIPLEHTKFEIMVMNRYFEKKREIFQNGLLTNPFLEKAAEIALTHHENWDGTGYPYGKKNNEIPLSGRIVAVADSYDAMRSKRPYKSAYSHEKTVMLMNKEAGFRYDPAIIRLFNTKANEFCSLWDRINTNVSFVQSASKVL